MFTTAGMYLHWLCLACVVGLVVAMQSPGRDFGAAAALGAGLVVAAVATVAVNTKRRRSKSAKENDARTRPRPRARDDTFEQFRVRILEGGDLECVRDGEGIEGTHRISLFHFFAYFFASQIEQFDTDTQAAMLATTAVREQMTKAVRAENLVINTGVSFWVKIFHLVLFEDFVLA